MDIKLRNMTSVYFFREGELLCLFRIGSRVANNRFVGAAGGHFEENELNRHVVYQKGTTNITNSPAWIEKSGKAEDVAYSFFDRVEEGLIDQEVLRN